MTTYTTYIAPLTAEQRRQAVTDAVLIEGCVPLFRDGDGRQVDARSRPRAADYWTPEPGAIRARARALAGALPRIGKVGVEIECGLHLRQVAVAFQAAAPSVKFATHCGWRNDSGWSDIWAGTDSTIDAHRAMHSGCVPKELTTRVINLATPGDRQTLGLIFAVLEWCGYRKAISVCKSEGLHVHVSGARGEREWREYSGLMRNRERSATRMVNRVMRELVHPDSARPHNGGAYTFGGVQDCHRVGSGRGGYWCGFAGQYPPGSAASTALRSHTRYRTMEFRLGHPTWCAADLVTQVQLAHGYAGVISKRAIDAANGNTGARVRRQRTPATPAMGRSEAALASLTPVGSVRPITAYRGLSVRGSTCSFRPMNVMRSGDWMQADNWAEVRERAARGSTLNPGAPTYQVLKLLEEKINETGFRSTCFDIQWLTQKVAARLITYRARYGRIRREGNGVNWRTIEKIVTQVLPRAGLGCWRNTRSARMVQVFLPGQSPSAGARSEWSIDRSNFLAFAGVNAGDVLPEDIQAACNWLEANATDLPATVSAPAPAQVEAQAETQAPDGLAGTIADLVTLGRWKYWIGGDRGRALQTLARRADETAMWWLEAGKLRESQARWRRDNVGGRARTEYERTTIERAGDEPALPEAATETPGEGDGDDNSTPPPPPAARQVMDGISDTEDRNGLEVQRIMSLPDEPRAAPVQGLTEFRDEDVELARVGAGQQTTEVGDLQSEEVMLLCLTARNEGLRTTATQRRLQFNISTRRWYVVVPGVQGESETTCPDATESDFLQQEVDAATRALNPDAEVDTDDPEEETVEALQQNIDDLRERLGTEFLTNAEREDLEDDIRIADARLARQAELDRIAETEAMALAQRDADEDDAVPFQDEVLDWLCNENGLTTFSNRPVVFSQDLACWCREEAMGELVPITYDDWTDESIAEAREAVVEQRRAA